MRKKTARAATLADVGKAAGVSAMAASTVLNGAQTSSRIAPETRVRILEAAKLLRYRPNAAARALADRRINTIGLATVVQGSELNQYFLEIFNGVLKTAALHDQNTTVFTLHDWERDAERIPGFCDGRIDGLILLAPVLSAEAAAESIADHTPFISIHANVPLPGVVNLESDEETGAFNLTRYLIAQGHRRILHLAGPRGILGAERRLRGYRRALQASGIPFDESLVVESGFSENGGHTAMNAWLRAHAGQPLPQAIFCGNDGCALGCMVALAESGIKVPDDLSVAGFDDTLAARATSPQLTSVRQPLREMGGQAVECLLDEIRHRHGKAGPEQRKPIVFSTELVLRASVAQPPSAPRIAPL
jgi:LacI family transcriptional regulator